MAKTHLEKAEDWGEIARNEEKYGGNPEQIGGYYLEQAKSYEKASKIGKAIKAYENALRYVPEKEKEIKEEIDNLKHEKTKMAFALSKMRMGVEKKLVFLTLSIISLASALVFTSFSLTGYSVLELTQNNSRFIGTILFILGLIFSFLYFKNKKKI